MNDILKDFVLYLVLKVICDSSVFPTMQWLIANHHILLNAFVPFYSYGLTLIPAWISNYIHYEVQPLKFRNG